MNLFEFLFIHRLNSLIYAWKQIAGSPQTAHKGSVRLSPTHYMENSQQGVSILK